MYHYTTDRNELQIMKSKKVLKSLHFTKHPNFLILKRLMANVKMKNLSSFQGINV